MRKYIYSSGLPEPPGVDDCTSIDNSLSIEQIKNLSIGTKVLINGDVDFVYVHGPKRRGAIDTFSFPIKAYYIGWTMRWEGQRTPGVNPHYGMDGFDPGEGPSFVPSRQVFVAKVVTGPRSKVINVLPKQISLTMDDKNG